MNDERKRTSDEEERMEMEEKGMIERTYLKKGARE